VTVIALVLVSMAGCGSALSVPPTAERQSIAGTVVDTRADAFIVDDGDGEVEVSTDAWGLYATLRPFLEGDEVVVVGYPVAHRGGRRTFEARSIYVRDLGARFRITDRAGDQLVGRPTETDPSMHEDLTVPVVGLGTR
jgi:hypothetical protein